MDLNNLFHQYNFMPFDIYFNIYIIYIYYQRYHEANTVA